MSKVFRVTIDEENSVVSRFLPIGGTRHSLTDLSDRCRQSALPGGRRQVCYGYSQIPVRPCLVPGGRSCREERLTPHTIQTTSAVNKAPLRCNSKMQTCLRTEPKIGLFDIGHDRLSHRCRRSGLPGGRGHVWGSVIDPNLCLDNASSELQSWNPGPGGQLLTGLRNQNVSSSLYLADWKGTV